MRSTLFFIMICLCLGCQSKPKINTKEIDIQGHRGCRGIMPENTIPAFLKAMELGVNTLELDLTISADSQVVVSHEPYMRAGICLKPDGSVVTEQEQYALNMYQMTYDSIKKYDVGSHPDDSHPNRNNIKAYKPLLTEVIREVRKYCDSNGAQMPYWNIEIKRDPQYDNQYHPTAQKFVELILPVIDPIKEKVTIQAFDPESLRVCREQAPELSYALLIQNDQSPEANIANLGFTPDIYSCYHKLVNPELMSYCREKEIRVIPWTVNDPEDIKAMKAMDVDGIISDYPDRVMKIYATNAHH